MELSTSILKQQERNWLELPSDVTANILSRIGMIDILENAQKVCTAWRKICLEPAMWRVIDTNVFLYSHKHLFWAKEMCKDAVDRSQGQLVDITLIHPLIISGLLPYVADRSSKLRRLEIAYYHWYYYSFSWTNVLMKFPLLEEFSFYSSSILKEEIEAVGRGCPMLKPLKVDSGADRFWGREGYSTSYSNEIAIAIGENLPELRHLELVGNNMSNIGLQAILDNCRHLETLDLRKCRYLDLKGELGRRCSRQIQYLKLPNDSIEDDLYIYLLL